MSVNNVRFMRCNVMIAVLLKYWVPIQLRYLNSLDFMYCTHFLRSSHMAQSWIMFIVQYILKIKHTAQLWVLIVLCCVLCWVRVSHVVASALRKPTTVYVFMPGKGRHVFFFQ